MKLKRLDQFFRRARWYGYTTKEYDTSSLIEGKIELYSDILYELFPEMKPGTLRTQNHN